MSQPEEQPDQDRTELARRIVATLPRFGRWANTVREFRTPYGVIGFRQAAILWIIRYRIISEDEMSPTRIAAHHHVQPSVVTRALTRLEASGFIERAVDPRDARRFRITITEKGQMVSEYVEDLFVTDTLDSIACLGAQEIDDLRRAVELLDRIVNDLERKRADRSRRP